MKNSLFLLIAFATIFTSCIKDDLIEDFVEPTIRITNIPDTIEFNTSFQFEYTFLNNIGQEENIDAIWSSSDTSILKIDNSGLATAISEGKAIVTASYSEGEIQLNEMFTVNIGANTVASVPDKLGTIQTTSSYLLEGDFTLNEDGDNLILEFGDDYKASTALPGLYIYLTNNKNSTANAYEIGKVETFSGAHSYTIENIRINDFNSILYFCKPFNVKVGDGDIN